MDTVCSAGLFTILIMQCVSRALEARDVHCSVAAAVTAQATAQQDGPLVLPVLPARAHLHLHPTSESPVQLVAQEIATLAHACAPVTA